MKAFINHLKIQFLMDLRDKDMLLMIYIVPLLFYAVVGAVFSSINPESKLTLAASMAIFAITMGAVLGIPSPLVKFRETGVLRAYDVCGIPGWAVLLASAVSALIHLLIVSIAIYITAPIFFGASLPVNILAWFVTLAAVLFSSISIGLLVGVTARNQATATMISQAVFLPSLLLGGLMFPSSMLPEALMWVGRVYPATHAMQAFSAWAYAVAGDIQPVVSILVVLGIGAAASGAAVYRFRSLRKII